MAMGGARVAAVEKLLWWVSGRFSYMARSTQLVQRMVSILNNAWIQTGFDSVGIWIRTLCLL
jgi:hypothetical protein